MTPEQSQLVQQIKTKCYVLSTWIDAKDSNLRNLHDELSDLVDKLEKPQLRVQISNGPDYVVVNFCRFDELKESTDSSSIYENSIADITKQSEKIFRFDLDKKRDMRNVVHPREYYDEDTDRLTVFFAVKKQDEEWSYERALFTNLPIKVVVDSNKKIVGLCIDEASKHVCT